MIGLGQKLGVANLMYSRIYREGKSYLCRLAMYDVEHKSAILEMPPQPSEDFNKLLEYERSFFAGLAEKEQLRSHMATAPVKVVPRETSSHKALWISLGVLGVGGGLTAVWVNNLGKSGGNSSPSFPDPKGPPGDTLH
jgi:hypothetical protein